MNRSQSFPYISRVRLPRVGTAAVVAAALLTSACAQSGLEVALPSLAGSDQDRVAGSPITTGSIAGAELPAVASAASGASAVTATSGGTASENAIAGARRQRLAGNKVRALAILDETAAADPENKALLKERGLLALELGQTKRAEELLAEAHDPNSPDWRTLSAWGAALAAQGRQSAAQIKLAEALTLAPDHPSILNNLALSYALDGKRDRAERLLRQAAEANGADARTKQNLALLLGLDGKAEEAKRVGSDVLPPPTVAANVAYLEKLKASSAKVSRREGEPADAVRQAQAGR